MASIRKRNGKYQAQVRRTGYKTLSRTFTHRKDAQEWANETELKADRRGMPENLKVLERMTLADMLIKYRDTVVVHKRGHKNETIIVNAFLRQSMCNKPLSDITSEDFERYKVRRLKSVLGSTINREFNIIKHAYNTAINVWELPINKNPLLCVSKALTPSSRAKRVSIEESQNILSHANSIKNPYISLIIQFALETGMRRSEILGVRMEHVDIKNRTLLIPDTKNGHERVIPLTLKALEVIKASKVKNGLVFPVHNKALGYHWDRICNALNLNDLHFHDLRHEAISRFFEMGLNVPEVALISGHRDFRMLFRYTHMKPESILNKFI